MDTKIPRRLTAGCLAAMALVAATIALGASHPSRPDDPPARAADDFSPYVTKDGGISRPTDYRETFMHLGTYAVATKPNQPVDEMHDVYARPEDVRAYRRDGKFPDGAVLVKEVTRVGSEKLTTGQSHWATDIKLWFVMIKDAKGRFPGNDLWGDGWGWALFLAKEPAQQRGDRLRDRLQDVPHPGQEGRLGVRPRIPGAREARPPAGETQGLLATRPGTPGGPTPTRFAAQENPARNRKKST